jgi:hypothetical protein
MAGLTTHKGEFIYSLYLQYFIDKIREDSIMMLKCIRIQLYKTIDIPNTTSSRFGFFSSLFIMFRGAIHRAERKRFYARDRGPDNAER